MGYTWTVVVLVLIGQQAPTPLDSFRANYASIKVDLDFIYEMGEFDGPRDLVWSKQGVNFHPKERLPGSLEGHWACDGLAEYHRFSSPKAVLEKAAQEKIRTEANKVFFEVYAVPKIEALWDGDVLAVHSVDRIRLTPGTSPSWKTIQATAIDREPGELTSGRSPFYWGFTFPFPQIIGSQFEGSAVTRQKGMLAGRPVEFEVYCLGDPKTNCIQLEVAYDSSVGYLPRFARRIDYGGRPSAYVKEMYLIEARPCSAGGFVPTELIEATYLVPDFRQKHAEYKPGDDLRLEKVGGGRFRATSFKDRTGPVALVELNDVHSLSGIGGVVPLRKGTTSITLSQVKTNLGRKLREVSRIVSPNIDQTELHQFDVPAAGESSSNWWLRGTILVVFTAAVAFVLLRYRRRVLPLVMIGLGTSLTGCVNSQSPAIKLTGSLKETRVLLKSTVRNLPVTLVVRNDGNIPIKLFSANGGCSCRKVEQSGFPTLLAPGAMMAIGVDVQVGRSSSPQAFRFEFESDHGKLEVAVPFFALFEHQFDPESFSASLNEGEEGSFAFTHRSIHRGEAVKSSATVRFPEALRAQVVNTTGGTVGGAPEFPYEDVTYQITIADQRLGTRREVIELVENDQIVIEASVVWKRASYLSTIPERVVLGSRPIRVFLRCTDEDVEFVKVFKNPSHLDVTIVSPREISIMANQSRLEQDSEKEWVVEVLTSSPKQRTLKFPVTRQSL